MAKLDINSCLRNFKSVYITQIDLSYFLQIAPLVFKDQTVYAKIKSDVQFVNQIGTQLFNYFNQKSTEEQTIWYESLKNGVNTSIADANAVKALIPPEDTHAADLNVILDAFIADYQTILETIPVIE